MTKIAMFPGQGAQVVGMGKTLFKEFSQLSESASNLLGYSIEELCLTGMDGKLHQTQYTQPALYVVNSFAYLQHRQHYDEEFDFFIGHSLGEYTALFAAGVLDFETGLRFVKKRGELMAAAKNGGMAAILGLRIDRVADLLRDNDLLDLDIANYNSETQIVIAGSLPQLVLAQDILIEQGAKYIPLNVSAAFHSRFMVSAARLYFDFISTTPVMADPEKVIANTTAMPHSTRHLYQALSAQLYTSVRWLETIRFLKENYSASFQEFGPGNVLTNLLAKMDG